MESLKLCDSDYRFMLVVWEHSPVSSGTLDGRNLRHIRRSKNFQRRVI